MSYEDSLNTCYIFVGVGRSLSEDPALHSSAIPTTAQNALNFLILACKIL